MKVLFDANVGVAEAIRGGMAERTMADKLGFPRRCLRHCGRPIRS